MTDWPHRTQTYSSTEPLSPIRSRNRWVQTRSPLSLVPVSPQLLGLLCGHARSLNNGVASIWSILTTYDGHRIDLI